MALESGATISFHHEIRLCMERSQPTGLTRICGVDEAGRGPLAGPVVACAFAFHTDFQDTARLNELVGSLAGLDDSKKLTASRRAGLYELLIDGTLGQFGVGLADPGEIDQLNILGATRLAMKRAVSDLAIDPVMALVDGLPLRPSPFPHSALVKGDSLSYSIAAASVIAKVTRDRLMEEADRQFPGYGFAGHKGYPTRQHLQALTDLGPAPIHRRSFAPLKSEQLELF